MDDPFEYIFWGLAILVSILIPCLATCDSDHVKSPAKVTTTNTQSPRYQSEAVKTVPPPEASTNKWISDFLNDKNGRQEYQAPTRSSSRSVSPDDAYDEGYSDGYEQGHYDGSHGYSHGWGYDDSTDYYDYYETMYQEGYASGYDDGFYSGQSEYEVNEEEDY